MAFGKKTGGRRKGSLNLRTRHRSSVAAKVGLSPVEYMLGVLRDDKASVERRDWAAATVAPYNRRMFEGRRDRSLTLTGR